MYIDKTTATTFVLEMNELEYSVIKRMIDKLIFNPDNVSNQFKVTDIEVEVINQMRTNLNNIR